jgi:precorrin-6A synthase
MKRLVLIGIGTGNPDHVTVQAARAINAADLILIPHKGPDKADLADLRQRILDATLTNAATRVVGFDLPVRDATRADYQAGVADWHDAIAQAWEMAVAPFPDAGTVALLVWGDPSLYDSTLRIAARLNPAPAVTVIPGISAPQVLAAAHGIALNTVGGPFLTTTGRRLRDHGWPEGAETLVVMLDGDCAFQTLDPAGLTIWWGAYVGMAEQILDHGPLAEAGPRIIARRAAARAAHGWIMDIYVLRRGVS